MTQPPQGGYPQQGGWPQQPGQQGGQPQQPGYQQPGQYGQQGGYPQAGQPGQPQQGGQPAHQPQQGSQPAYQPPAGGYQHPGQGYGQQSPYAGPGYGQPTPAKAPTHWSGYAAIAAALVVFIAGFLPFYSASFDLSGVDPQMRSAMEGALDQTAGSSNAWTLWWWVPIVLAVLVAVALALVVFNVISSRQLQPMWIFYGAVLVVVTMIGVIIHAFVGPTICQAGQCISISDAAKELESAGIKLSSGPGWGLWVALVAALALAYFTFEYARRSRSKSSGSMPQQGYPQQGYPQQGYPQQGNPQQGNPQQGNQQSWG